MGPETDDILLVFSLRYVAKCNAEYRMRTWCSNSVIILFNK